MLQTFFTREGIEHFAVLSPEDVTVWDRAKYERMEGEIGKVKSVVVFLIPYGTGQKTTNLSVYAQVRDYHLYLRELSTRFDAYLRERGYKFSFRGFTDSSPIAEREAALKAGLGVLGKNGLVLHPRYGSFFFIGEFFMTKEFPTSPICETKYCPDCGACVKACPTGAVTDPQRTKCLSLLSQKKGRSAEEEALVAEADCKWGCDICQNVCPLNRKAEKTPIPFFYEDLVERLDFDVIEAPKEEFQKRAFSWRGRELLRKNLGNQMDKNKTDFS